MTVISSPLLASSVEMSMVRQAAASGAQTWQRCRRSGTAAACARGGAAAGRTRLVPPPTQEACQPAPPGTCAQAWQRGGQRHSPAGRTAWRPALRACCWRRPACRAGERAAGWHAAARAGAAWKALGHCPGLLAPSQTGPASAIWEPHAEVSTACFTASSVCQRRHWQEAPRQQQEVQLRSRRCLETQVQATQPGSETGQPWASPTSQAPWRWTSSRTR